MENIHKTKVEKAREKTLSDQFEVRRAKNKASRERKFARREERLAQLDQGRSQYNLQQRLQSPPKLSQPRDLRSQRSEYDIVGSWAFVPSYMDKMKPNLDQPTFAHRPITMGHIY
ncbi:hypothetical protein P3S68_012349 [Capsicum galapagoense]